MRPEIFGLCVSCHGMDSETLALLLAAVCPVYLFMYEISIISCLRIITTFI